MKGSLAFNLKTKNVEASIMLKSIVFKNFGNLHNFKKFRSKNSVFFLPLMCRKKYKNIYHALQIFNFPLHLTPHYFLKNLKIAHPSIKPAVCKIV